MKQCRPSKTLSKATSPYKFVEYRGPHPLVAVIKDKRGKLIESSASNRLPYHGEEELLLPSFVIRDHRAWNDRLEGLGPSQFSSSDSELDESEAGEDMQE